MRLMACTCKPEHYRRGHRPWWLKLATTRRLYHCYACDAHLLIPPHEVAARLGFHPAVAGRLSAQAIALAGSMVHGNEPEALRV